LFYQDRIVRFKIGIAHLIAKPTSEKEWGSRANMLKLKTRSWRVSVILLPAKTETIVVRIQSSTASINRIVKQKVKKENFWARTIKCQTFKSNCEFRNQLQKIPQGLIVNVICTERENDFIKGSSERCWQFGKSDWFDEKAIGIKIENNQLNWIKIEKAKWACRKS
jgi:hypothetical protein